MTVHLFRVITITLQEGPMQITIITIITIPVSLSMYGFGHPLDFYMLPFTGHGFLPGDGDITPVGGGHGDHLHGMYGILSIVLIMLIAALFILAVLCMRTAFIHHEEFLRLQ